MNFKNIFKKIIVKIVTWQARLVLKKYKPKIIAITGSVGKTSTKDAIFTVLSQFKTVRKSQKSFNSEIGLPLTILGCQNGWSNPFIWIENIISGFLLILIGQSYPEYLILEVGVGKPGDIKNNVAPWLNPDIVVITRFPDKPVHVEFFESVESIIEEKSALAFALKKDGILVLNHDDEKVYNIHNKANRTTVSYGFNDNATYKATYPVYLNTTVEGVEITRGISFKLEHDGHTFPVMLPNIIGMNFVGSALAAIAVAAEVGCDLLASINYISEYNTPPSRLSLIEGINNSMIIDDTYNSSPVAALASVEVLKDMKGKRKIAVLGDMLELGRYTEEEHHNLGKEIASVADILVVVGPRARFIAEGAIENGFNKKELYSFDSSKTVAKFLEGIIDKGDLVLIKGSQGVRLERAVVAIMAHKELKSKLVCRQEKEWENR
ncbi:MAG: UDP-N-acetylmuramoyl-tripeptide-D-alanyl-D-alanine ligase [Candidatus Nomurabacteria bacterium GW2011_GWF2_35_66]|uniref:UDP-N-acetylmuramoyl-tripeptide-D-alanyl-D-alanine ligase n=1 Tax=Candidatus Nomurabacteria bacterium GW2011_GWE1_35_16 TaxID=1618761 RepID=A0A0G0DTD3_9BACT|nr:MAG: UDP-N-acetylmuramoyl-tripeptide-D-alanyl-D-alanine ligase [Candidatus Nomurabacteria bacterium GW2011_GWF1_34_20]KKP62851.1 MAG: UDP-N-acetylmuramoyl-tripeptide-D-alanyl-D-alanine ligase [Candidatus Nomurabacteria bacterium GW2011_GWE2_34_25]KKP66250.1 MAG: UDP-N-acetylmuramoyl-tripeptide-D-alanyl-D-alanine ligase [Candidatus Nomurabacteria bacterium GW2011_GWE1_35_16]KKP83082.1 MAG: UDP-N-acetylmuramoyl-tripeptide-D-alanyl-D-alanine ligase [Candidatus Nomurabacteria bacterium GW2011_GWF